MALILYRRHIAACVQKRSKAGDTRTPGAIRSDRSWRRCSCPIHAEGTLRLDGFIRRSTGETVWQRAEEWKAEAERRGTLEPVIEETADDGPKPIRIAEAFAIFREDQKARHLGEDTAKKWRVLFDQIGTFSTAHRLLWMHEMDVAALTKFRGTLKDNGISAYKKLERLKSFFLFASLMGWKIAKPPAGKKTVAHVLRPPKETGRPTMPYPREQMAAILAAIGRMHDNTAEGALERLRLRLLILLMRYSGLAIVDAATLTSDRLLTNGHLFLRRAKTGVPVTIKLPDAVAEGLRQLPLYRGQYFFWNRQTDDSKRSTLTGNWRRKIRRLLKIAGVEKPSNWAITHSFRDTFAVEYLASGGTMANLQILLGHKSIKTTETHYAPYDLSRRRHLDETIDQMHAKEQQPLYMYIN
jgi:integrase